jgi:hypothetical protein
LETEVRHVDEKKGEIRDSYVNFGEAARELGFKLDVSIREGWRN